MATVLAVVGVLVLVLVALGVVFFLGMRAKSPIVQGLVRRMNRRFVHPRQLRSAGRPGAYASIVRHVGRKNLARFKVDHALRVRATATA